MGCTYRALQRTFVKFIRWTSFWEPQMNRLCLGWSALIRTSDGWTVLCGYREDDHEIATDVLSSIKRHLWYLCEEFVVLSLFNEKLGSFTRGRLAQKLLSIQRPVDFKLGNPKFPVIDELLLGPRSWLPFFFARPQNKSRLAWSSTQILEFNYGIMYCKGFLSSTRRC